MGAATAIKHQYHAALKTLREVIEKCPDRHWTDLPDGGPPTWRVACHTLFFTHFYLQKNQVSLVPWKGHRRGAEQLGRSRPRATDAPDCDAPYTRQEILEYWRFCDEEVDGLVDAMDLSAGESGFPWYPMPKMEHQIVNIRHIQHHAAMLSARLRTAAGVEVQWVGGA